VSAELDARVATAMSLNPAQVSIYRDEWNRTPQSSVVRTIFKITLQDQIDERMRKLRKCDPEDLKTLQGELNGLELAQSLLSEKTTTTT
jgi:hypothetical protein